MAIRMIDLSHADTEMEIRERCAFKKREATEALLRLKDHFWIKGCILLSTCNRTQLWAEVNDLDVNPPQSLQLRDVFCQLKDLRGLDIQPKELDDAEAVRYLFELTAGLHSQIIGEDQILTQVNEAAALSRELEVSSKTLDTLFRMAVTSAKKIKTEVRMPRANASVAGAAISYLQKAGYEFGGKKVLVIGNGMMGKLTANLLMEEGAEVTVTVRQYHSGLLEIPENARRIDYGRRYDILPECDFCFSATASPNLTIRKEDVELLELKEKFVFIDLAMPRDIDPAVGMLPRVTLIGMDDLKTDEMSEELQSALVSAKKLILQAVADYERWYAAKDLVSQIDSIADKATEDLLWRLQKTLKQAGKKDISDISADKSQMNREVTNPDDLKKEIGIACGKVIKKLLFAMRDEIDHETLRVCLSVMEKTFR